MQGEATVLLNPEECGGSEPSRQRPGEREYMYSLPLHQLQGQGQPCI